MRRRFRSRGVRTRGIPARLIRPGVMAANADRRETGLLVYVDRNGLVYLNSKLMTPGALPAALEMSWRAAAIGQCTSRAIRVPRLAR